jgi:hypothetical protein
MSEATPDHSLTDAEKALLEVVTLIHENSNVSGSKLQAILDKYLERCRSLSSTDYDVVSEDATLIADIDALLASQPDNSIDLEDDPTITETQLADIQKRVCTPAEYFSFCGLDANLCRAILTVMSKMLSENWRTFPILKKPSLVKAAALNNVPGFVKKYIPPQFIDDAGKCTVDVCVFCSTPKTNRADIAASITLIALPLPEWEKIAAVHGGYRHVDNPIPFCDFLVMIMQRPKEAFNLPSNFSAKAADEKARRALRAMQNNEKDVINVLILTRWLQVNVFPKVFNLLTVALSGTMDPASYDFETDFTLPLAPTHPDIKISAGNLASHYVQYLVDNSLQIDSAASYYALIGCYSSFFDNPLKGPKNFAYQHHHLAPDRKNFHEPGPRFDLPSNSSTGPDTPLQPSTIPTTSILPLSLPPSSTGLPPSATPTPPTTITTTTTNPSSTIATTTPIPNHLPASICTGPVVFRPGTHRQHPDTGRGRGRGRSSTPSTVPRSGFQRSTPYPGRGLNPHQHPLHPQLRQPLFSPHLHPNTSRVPAPAPPPPGLDSAGYARYEAYLARHQEFCQLQSHFEPTAAASVFSETYYNDGTS